jgi:hypothetical protein
VKKAVLVMIALSLAVLSLGGCAGKSSELQMKDTTVVPPTTGSFRGRLKTAGN